MVVEEFGRVESVLVLSLAVTAVDDDDVERLVLTVEGVDALAKLPWMMDGQM